MSNKIEIKGLNLRIDNAIERNCEVSNNSSGTTRSILYALFILNILSIICVINTHMYNWTENRIAKVKLDIATKADERDNLANWVVFFKESIKARQTKLGKIDNYNLQNDTLYYNKILRELDYTIEHKKYILEIFERNKIENYINVNKVPILGNSFDVNNLIIVAGLSFTLLLIVLKLSLSREKTNLRISLISISERYTDEIIEPEFDKDINRIIDDSKSNFSKNDIIKAINKVRRKHHYNFLSMNEIFNMPPLETSNNTFGKTRMGKFVDRYLYYFPYIIYLLIFMNDLTTYEYGLDTNKIHTYFGFVFGLFFISIISKLCAECNNQKRIMNDLYSEYFINNYSYKHDEETTTENIVSLKKEVIKFNFGIWILKFLKKIKLFIMYFSFLQYSYLPIWKFIKTCWNEIIGNSSN